MDDANFQRRYEFFYEQLAPSLELYRVRVGDTLTIKAFTKSGYVQSINLQGLRHLQLHRPGEVAEAGQLNLMDLVSFRELYGYLTDDKKAEIAALKAGSNSKDVSRENAEAELFGSKTRRGAPRHRPGRTVTANATPGVNPDEALAGLAGRLQREELASRVYDPKQLEGGVVLNAAVLLARSQADGRDDEGHRGGGQGGGPAAQGDLLAGGLGLHRPVRDHGVAGAGHGDVDHLRGRAGHHQQRAGDGDPGTGARRSAPCARSAPSAGSSWAC